MAEVEAPTEAIEEQLHHHAHASKEDWISQVALSSAVLAVFAAISALMANHHADEAMITQIQASDQWTYFQAKSIKGAVLANKVELLGALGKTVAEKDHDKIAEYKKEQDEISEKAQDKERESSNHLKHHAILARAVTMFQVAIAIAAIAVLSRRRKAWILGLGFGFVGLVFMAQGFLF